jgi:hypothetical protein
MEGAAMRRFIVAAIASLVVAAFSAGSAAANPTGTPGQPNQDCESLSVQPPGFGTGGFANAKNHYADPSILPSTANGHAVSQYDVACFQLSSHSG